MAADRSRPRPYGPRGTCLRTSPASNEVAARACYGPSRDIPGENAPASCPIKPLPSSWQERFVSPTFLAEEVRIGKGALPDHFADARRGPRGSSTSPTPKSRNSAADRSRAAEGSRRPLAQSPIAYRRFRDRVDDGVRALPRPYVRRDDVTGPSAPRKPPRVNGRPREATENHSFAPFGFARALNVARACGTPVTERRERRAHALSYNSPHRVRTPAVGDSFPVRQPGSPLPSCATCFIEHGAHGHTEQEYRYLVHPKFR